MDLKAFAIIEVKTDMGYQPCDKKQGTISCGHDIAHKEQYNAMRDECEEQLPDIKEVIKFFLDWGETEGEPYITPRIDNDVPTESHVTLFGASHGDSWLYSVELRALGNYEWGKAKYIANIDDSGDEVALSSVRDVHKALKTVHKKLHRAAEVNCALTSNVRMLIRVETD